MAEGESGRDASGAETVAETATDASPGNENSQQRRTRGRGSAFDQLGRGDAIGRYLVLDKLGAGGMGVVYAAYDPELDRRIAIKLLRPDALGSTGATVGEARLLREARAMAKLAAPNVVTVHDIGTFDEQVYVAMEFVDGQTLSDWWGDGRGWQEVVDVFKRAGRGLAAAHAAGLVHRDFKPDNVMIAKDGRILVMDFGLVRQEEDEDESGAPDEPDELVSSSRPSDSRLTRAGSVMGTPAYMAPEQHLGLATDARTDQFSFCVALFEGLYRKRPFRGDSLAALAFQVTEGNVQFPEDAPPVPAWLKKVVVRGLSSQPEDRYPSMDALLTELERDPALSRRRWYGIGVVSLAVGAIAVGALRGEAGASMCEGAQARLAEVWNDARKTDARAAFSATDVVYAEDTWSRVEKIVDDYASEWVEGRVDACEATQVRGEQSAERMDLRMACLDRRLEAVDALAQIYADADAALIPNAVAAAHKLPPLSACADADYLTAAVPPPEDEAVRGLVEDIRDRLITVQAMEAAGRYGPGLELADHAWEEAKATGYRAVEAEVAFQVGLLQRDVGKHEDARRALEQAVWAGRASKNDGVAARAIVELAGVEGLLLKRPERAQLWLDAGTAEAQRLGDDYLLARLHGRRGLLLDEQVKYDDALAAYEAELFLLDNLGRGETIDAAVTLNNLGSAAYANGEYARADEYYTRALDISRKQLGDLHPAVAVSLGNLGLTAKASGDLTRTLALREEALRLKEESLGPEHPSVAYALDSLGSILLELGDPEEARGHFERSLRIRTHQLGPEHADTAYSEAGLGNALRGTGDLEAALDHQRRAIATLERVRGPAHPSLASFLDETGQTLTELGRFEESTEAFKRSLSIREQSLGTEHPEIAASLLGLAQLELARGKLKPAETLLRRGLQLSEAEDGRKELLGELRFALARALARADGTDEEVERLADLAHRDYEAAGQLRKAEAVVQWRSERAEVAKGR